VWAATSEAERRARLEFGAIEATKDECRQAWGLQWMDELRADPRFPELLKKIGLEESSRDEVIGLSVTETVKKKRPDNSTTDISESPKKCPVSCSSASASSSGVSPRNASATPDATVPVRVEALSGEEALEKLKIELPGSST
jgi:hypothetical protein